MTIYKLHDFQGIIFKGFSVTLPPDTIDKVNNIVKQVGSPNYIKTPSFQKTPRQENAATGFSKKRRDKAATEANNAAQWAKIKKFQPTKMDEKTGIESDINEIRCYLNKLTDKNIDEITDKIIEMMDTYVDTDSESRDADIKRMGDTIFEIASNNRFFSRVYADVYGALYSRYEVMQTLLKTNYSAFLEQFNTIHYTAPEEDYNEFCRTNKNNEKRRALSSFYLHLYFSGVLTFDKIEYLVEYMLTKILALIKEENKVVEVDEYTENVCILYDKDAEYSEDICLENGLSIKDTINNLANTKMKTYPSLSTKCIFKYMDLCGI